MLSRFGNQLTTLLLLLPTNILVGLLPLCIVRLVGRHNAEDQGIVIKRNRVLSFLIHFGGGVFLSTCFLILIPESQQRFLNHHHSTDIQDDAPQSEGHHDDFPIPEFIVLCGFFGTFAIEELIKYFIFLCQRKIVKHDPRVRFCSCAKRHTECSRTFKADNPDQTIFGLEKQKFLESQADSVKGEVSALNRSGETATNAKSCLLQSSMLAQAIPSYGSVAIMSDPPTNQPLQAPPVLIEKDGNVTIIHPQPIPTVNTEKTSNILLLISLSIYGLIQGLSLGETIGYSSWESVAVSCLQQAVLVFVIGSVSITESRNLLPVLVYIGPLSVMYSLGVCITAFFKTEIQRISDPFWGVAISVVCGSLLYLIFCDLFRRDSVRKMCGREKFVGFTIGAAIVAALLYLSVIL